MSQRCLAPTACELDGDCDEGFTCTDEGQCSIGGDCGGFVFEIEAVPPNLLVLLDRSGSMDGSVSGTSDNRWEVAKQAVGQVTSAFNTSIRFGLATYSACLSGGCSAGTIEVPIADDNALSINQFLSNTVGQGSSNGQALDGQGRVQYLCDSGDPETSTGKSLAAFVGEASLLDPERQNAILLITDGSESGECIDNSIDGPAGAASLFAQNPPVRTFAVGFVGANEGELAQIATAGGTDQSYFANDPTMLQEALDQIAASVASCTFSLDQVPPDAAEIYVFFDKDPMGVPNDMGDGWTYDEATNSVTFHGASCEAIQSATVTDIDIVFGCNMPPVG
jgi:hypothetical protein